MSEFVKVVLVTGGSSGLGRAICSHLAAKGHVVYGTSRKASGDQVTDGFHMVNMDVTDEASVRQAVEGVIQREGRIDVLVNNAGLGIQGPVEDTPVDLVRQLFDTNLHGPLRAIQAVLPHMRAQGRGLIINISSVGANFGLPYRGFYSASKAALDRMGQALAIEVARFGVKVVSVQPGEFNTSIANNRLRPEVVGQANRPGYEKAMEVLGGSMHYSRDPIELAQVVAGIVAAPKPQPNYVVAQGVQRMSVVLSKVLPGRWFQRMLGKHYE